MPGKVGDWRDGELERTSKRGGPWSGGEDEGVEGYWIGGGGDVEGPRRERKGRGCCDVGTKAEVGASGVEEGAEFTRVPPRVVSDDLIDRRRCTNMDAVPPSPVRSYLSPFNHDSPCLSPLLVSCGNFRYVLLATFLFPTSTPLILVVRQSHSRAPSYLAFSSS